MSDLFPDLPTVLSPRLKWMQEHGVSVEQKYVGPCAEDTELKWVASSFIESHKGKGYSSKAHTFSTGDTEEDAIIRLAQRNGWPLWNEV